MIVDRYSNKNYKEYVAELKSSHNNCVRITYHGYGITKELKQSYVKKLTVNMHSINMDGIEYVQSEIYANMKIEIDGKIETIVINDGSALELNNSNVDRVDAGSLTLNASVGKCQINASQLNCGDITESSIIADNIDCGDIKTDKLEAKNNISASDVVSDTINCFNLDGNDITGDINVSVEGEYSDQEINCNNILGDITIENGNIDCGDISGDVTIKKGEIDCGDIIGDVKAKSVNCADLNGNINGTFKSISHNDSKDTTPSGGGVEVDEF